MSEIVFQNIKWRVINFEYKLIKLGPQFSSMYMVKYSDVTMSVF